jgi:class 3 adenylate cyclase
VGDTVNLASRLQAITKKIDTEMLISAETHASLGGSEIKGIRFRPPEKISVRGRTERVKVYALRRA